MTFEERAETLIIQWETGKHEEPLYKVIAAAFAAVAAEEREACAAAARIHCVMGLGVHDCASVCAIRARGERLLREDK